MIKPETYVKTLRRAISVFRDLQAELVPDEIGDVVWIDTDIERLEGLIDQQEDRAQGGEAFPDCDTCGKPLDYMPWHYSKGDERHLHACDECWPKVNPSAGAVPEGWRSVIQGAIDELGIMDESEGVAGWHLNGAIASWDESGLPAIRDALVELLSTTTAPQADEWVKCSDRLPTEADGYVWLYFQATGVSDLIWRWDDDIGEDGETHWKPTGLTRPQPPEQGDDV